MLHLFCVFFFSLPKSDKYVFNFLYVNVVFFCTCYEEENKNIKKKQHCFHDWATDNTGIFQS